MGNKRTQAEQSGAKEQETRKMHEIKAIVSRSSATFLQDLAGGVGLVIVLVGGLYLPSLF